jgi:dihydrolipoamide dehydrogenase
MATVARTDIRIPDIGDFRNVPVIEVLVKPGDEIAQETPLVTLESDKATMDVPSPSAGKVAELKVKIGDKVSEGTVILTLEAADAVGEEKAATAQAPAPAAPAPKAAAHSGGADIPCEMMVLGAGPGGYSAAFRAADLGLSTVLVERWAVLGGVCLNVGCIPSKALLHTAAIMDEVKAMSAHGIKYREPEIDLPALRNHKDKVVGKLTSGLAGMAKARKVTVVTGTGRFLDPNHIEVTLTNGSGKRIVKFESAIIAAGSEAVKLPFIPEDPRIVDSTGALELRQIPEKLLVIGGGIIGLEMATVYSTLGARLEVVEMLDGLMPEADRDLVKVWERMNAPRFDAIMLKTKTVAVGRSPNGKLIDAGKAGIAVSERGFISVDKQMRTNVQHIFAIGDIAGGPMLAHKAVHEGHVAAEAAARKNSFFDARQIPSVAYTDPEIAWAGLTETEAKANGFKFEKAVFPWAASGRAIANGRDEGFTKLLFHADTHRCIGGGIVGAHAGDLISEICLAIEMGADASDIGKTIHPHPTLSESIGMAAEVAEGVCTDLPPMKRKQA